MIRLQNVYKYYPTKRGLHYVLHDASLEIPTGVNVAVDRTNIKISGPDKQTVGQFAAAVRAKRKPEPYNGKGIKYTEEVIRRKAGKAFGA